MEDLMGKEEVIAPSKPTGARNASFELLRIISMVMIIILHLLGYGGFLENSVGANHIVMEIVQILCFVCVNLFVMISSYFMVGKKIKPKKLLYLWIEVVFYIAFFYLLLLAVGEVKPSLKDLNNLVPIITLRYWFITAYFIFYLSIPFLNVLVENLDKKGHLVLCAGLLVLCFVDIIDSPIIWSLNRGMNALWFMFLFIFTSFVKKYQTKSLPWYVYLLIYLAACALSYFTEYFYSHPLTLIASFSIFEIFKNIKITNEKFGKFILTVSNATFGVYLIHENHYFRPVMFDTILSTYKYHTNQYALLIMLGFALAIFVACTIVELLRQQLFKLVKLIFDAIKKASQRRKNNNQ